MKKLICTLLFIAFVTKAWAQESEVLKLQGEVRADYLREYIDGKHIKSGSGLQGQYLNLRLDGKLNDSFSYSFRHRLNKLGAGTSFFNATDWAYLTYKPSDRWAFSAGKQVVAIGGYEYDRAPIDLYFCSEYWNNIPCYQFGGSVSYTMPSGKDQLTLQVCQSPFDTPDTDMYAVNLLWSGNHGFWNTLSSVNLIEIYPGEFITYLTLGNRFDFGKVAIELDWMNRATRHQGFFFKDNSVMGEITWNVSSKLRLLGKATYDLNRTNTVGDFCVLPGTELTRVGAGFEYFPLRNGSNMVRLHGTCSYAWGKNSNPDGTMQPKQMLVNVGLTWKVNLLSLKH